MRRHTCAPLGLLLLTIFGCSEGLLTKVQPNKDSKVTVSTKLPAAQCAVCTVSGVNDTQTSCHSSLTLEPAKEVKLLFNCSQPLEQAFSVTVARTIECTKDACNPTTVETQPAILSQFARTFTWDIVAPKKTVVGLNILGEGLRVHPDPCEDGHQFTVATSPGNSEASMRYCKGGSVTHLELLNQAVVSLQVQPNVKVESVLFQASAGPLKGRVMVLTVDSSTTVTLRRDPKKAECDVCRVDGSTPTCNPTEMTVTNVENLSLEFGCRKPEEVFNVNMKKTIGCTKSSCTPSTGDIHPDVFKDFEKLVTWDISVPERTVLTLGIAGSGLKETPPSGKCQDGPLYSVSTTKRNGQVKTSTYCRGGTLAQLNMLGATTVTLEVPKGTELNNTIFSAKATQRAGRMMSVTPDPETIIMIRRESEEPDCSVCMDKPPNQQCKPDHLTLRDPRNTSVEFTCPQPQEVYSVEINREIDCTATSCSGNIVQPESMLFPDFNRTFTWDLKVHSTRSFQLDFPEPGMRQIPNEETCPDEHTYSLITYLRSGPATIGTFCKGGTVTTIQVLYKGRMVLQVPGDRKLDPVDFKLSVGAQTSKVAIVKVNLPRGVSDTEFLSASYPGDFPDNQQMMWNFTVPGMHNYTMHFRDHTAPECIENEAMVEYQKEGKKAVKSGLTDPQPEHQQGNFNMVLVNCKTNRTLQGLALRFSVSVMRSGHPVLCTVDLSRHKAVSLQVEKVGSDPYCEMSVDSKVEKKINVAAGKKAALSFLDCPNEDVRLTASKVIACKNISSCSSAGLFVPTLESCLPMPLHSFTWHLNIPMHATIDLASPSGTLRQSLPGQVCNRSASLHVAEEGGVPVGDFCSGGTIRKVQVHANVSVMADARDFRKTRGPFLNATFSQEIPETIIYKVSPKASAPTLLATPNWPQGMGQSSTVAWIVNVPSQYRAQLRFNVSQPKCGDRHTAIKVKLLGYEEELMSRREDEESEEMLSVPHSFYLNMSNCVTESGHFGALTQIVLEKKTNLLAIILGLLGAIALLLIVLAVVCVVTKKKKKEERMNKEASIYMGKGNIFRPGNFPKARSDNDSHVYASIDETMVYGHLLGESSYADSIQDHYKGMQVDSYQTFMGPTDGGLPVIKEPDPEPEMEHFNMFLDPSETFIPSRPRTPIDRQDSLGFQDRRMVDNELYTFKSTGDMNTIRLSGIDMDEQPHLEDSL